MRLFGKIMKYVALALLLLVFAGFVALQLPRVQTSLTAKATQKLEEIFDADISIGHISLKPFTILAIRDLDIIDRAPVFPGQKDTLLHVGSLNATFSLMSLIGPGHEDFILKRVKIEDADFNLAVEGGENYSTNLNRMFLLGKDKPSKEPKERDIFNIRHLEGHNLHYTMRLFSHPMKQLRPWAVNWSDVDVYDADIIADDFRMSHGRFYADAKHISFKEKSGWEVTHMSGKTISGCADAYIYDIHLEDSFGSVVEMDYRMLGRTEDFQDYVHRVMMEADVKYSRLSLATLARFIPPFNPDPDTFITLTGNARGPVCDLDIMHTDLRVEGSSIRTAVSGTVRNLPDVDNMYFDAKADGTQFTTTDLTAFLHAIAPKSSKLDLGRFGAHTLFSADLTAKGYINSLDCNANIRQGRSGGRTSLKAKAMNVLARGTKAISVNGSISTASLDLGSLLGNSILGCTDLSSGFSVTMPHGDFPLEAHLKDVDIKGITVNGYTYKDISGSAALIGDDMSADIHSEDANCDADIAIWSEKYAYNGAINIHNANLNAMNIDKRGKSEVAMNLYGRMERDFDKLQGNASLTDIYLTNSEGMQHIGDITLDAGREDGFYDIQIDSDDLSGSFQGNLKQLQARLRTFDTSALLAFLMPGAYIDSGTVLDALMDADGNITGKFTTHRIALGDNYIKDLSCNLEGTLQDLDATLNAEEIKVQGLSLANNNVKICYVDSTARMQYNFNNHTDQPTYGRFDIDATIGRHKRLGFDIKPSEFCVNGDKWTIPASSVDIQGKEISVDGFSMSSSGQSVWVNGRISQKREDLMNARIKNLDLSFINNILKSFNLDISGSLNADASIQSPIGEEIPQIGINLYGDGVHAGGMDMGRITAICQYDTSLDHFYLSMNERIKGEDVILASAILNPENKNIDASITLDKFPFDFAQRFIPSVFTELGGTVSGDFFLNGPIKSMDIRSRGARVDNGHATVAYTHVPYTMDGTLKLDNDGIHIDKVNVADRFGTKAAASGGVLWDKGRHLEMDVRLDINGVEAVNIPSSDTQALFYGQIFGSGTATFKGPFTGLTMGLNVRPVGNSQMHIAISDDAVARKGGILTFVDPSSKTVDPYEEHLRNLRERKRRNSEFKIDLHAEADPTFKVLLDLGSNQFSSGMEAAGNGAVDIKVNTATSEYTMFGDYILTEGKVDVNASNLVRRVFQVQSGGSIRFQGDIFDSQLDLDANYETKASISSLIADDDGVGTRRSVLCGINVSNVLRNPQIKFSVKIPDLNPTIKTSVEGALSTEDKVQKQFLSLLLSNNFLPDEQSGIVNNSSLLYSNVSEIMANQVNNIFNKLDIPLDLGLNYMPTERGTNLFDVALSTQLFNNRVIIGGNFGNRQNITSNTETFFGDLDVQYKVTRSGALRVKAFSHSADKYSNFLDNGQRNGVGLSWQQEFDTFPEWFKRLFSNKAKRDALRQMEAERIKNLKTITLDE